MNDGHVAPVIHVFQGPHLRVESNLVINLDDALVGNTDCRTGVPVDRVGVGNNCVQVVISSRQLEYYQYRVFFCACHVLAIS